MHTFPCAPVKLQKMLDEPVMVGTKLQCYKDYVAVTSRVYFSFL